ncbi:hypothetical protein MTR67_037260 [Solanum verrucosum]|uniref:glutathione transferase n=1 Tax=Solanum verrucosum TaxID=315347 RepID=A0AAF0UDL1_SOLVR|nr:hypothetical protein MTR67_037260 [Solanum verrucosum]
MTLKLYVDRLSQSCREVIIFCKLNGIDFEEVYIELSKRHQLSPEFREINPIQQIPAIMDGKFKLSERYPADLYKRAKVDSVLDWHHSNLRRGTVVNAGICKNLGKKMPTGYMLMFSAGYIFNTVLAPAFGLPLNPQAAAEAKKVLLASLANIESVWLQRKGRFLLGSGQPSIADLSLVCELMELEILDEKDRERIIGPYKRVLKWIDDTKNAMEPHFQEVHVILYKAKEKFHKQRHAVGSSIPQSSRKPDLHSKIFEAQKWSYNDYFPDRLNGIDFEEVHIDLSKRQQRSPEYREINPIRKIPAIMDGRFKLSESHAILRYLACAFPRIADHWYPTDLYKRAKVESVLDWQRTTFPSGSGSYVFHSVLGPAVGIPLNTKAAARTEKNLIASLALIESVWLQKKGRFLLGSDQPSIADLSLACEIMALEVLDDKDHERILGPFKRVLKWLDDTKNAMAPHFEEVQSTLSNYKEKVQKQRNTLTKFSSGGNSILTSEIPYSARVAGGEFVGVNFRLNGIDFEEIHINLSKRQQLSPEFKEINPMKQVPAIMDGRFKLFESHAILRYLACAFPGIADHWYPADLYKRAKVDSVLDWHHSNLRRGTVVNAGICKNLGKRMPTGYMLMFSAGYIFNTVLAPAFGLPLNPQAAAEAKKVLLASLANIESVWLQRKGRFLLGSGQPSIADLSLVCELIELEILDEKDRERIIGPYKRVLKWIDDTKNAMEPHLQEADTSLAEPMPMKHGSKFSAGNLKFLKFSSRRWWLNGIEFEEVSTELFKRQQLSPEFEEVNPMKQVPAIMDGRFKLFESHAILRYLACAFPGIADHWYPADLYKRAKVESVLDWHHSNLHRGAGYTFSTVLAPAFGLALNPKAAAKYEKVLLASLAKIESVCLQREGQFLLGSGQPSIADLSLVCEIMQLEILDEKDRERIIGPYKRVLKWIDDAKNAMEPHLQEVHVILFKAKQKFHKQRYIGSSIPQSSIKPEFHSKM